MLLLNGHPDHRHTLAAADVALLGADGAAEAERFLKLRDGHAPTPLLALPGLAANLGVAAVHVKDEGKRLGLGSFKALGGAYAVTRLVLEAAEVALSRPVAPAELSSDAVRAVACSMTFACATDGNHGRSVAQGAALVGARSVVFVHAGVSKERVEAIASCGARTIKVPGTYDDSVREAQRVAVEQGWTLVSDTSWQGYERIPGLVMQGYTPIAREALAAIPEPPSHVFVQAGVGGLAAAVAAHFEILLADRRPTFVVVEPERAACLFESARLGRPVKIDHGEPTVMAMLECYEPSLVAWRILARAADAFMTIDEADAIAAMNRFARPLGRDLSVVSGESGGAGLAGLMVAAGDPATRAALELGRASRVFLINTEGATDQRRYEDLVGLAPGAVAA
jgi:diaminopropionate ammonia-lyase